MPYKIIEVKEKSRTYFFGIRQTVTLKNVKEVIVTDSTHRVKTIDGRLHIIPNTWLRITIEAKDWVDTK